MSALIQGMHHVCLKCCNLAEFDEVVKFYTEVLGLPVSLRWGTAERPAVLIDLGGVGIEIFSDGTDRPQQGAIRHFALKTDAVDACVAAVRTAGYPITVEPKAAALDCEPPLSLRIAFCRGPLGEEIEFYQELSD